MRNTEEGGVKKVKGVYFFSNVSKPSHLAPLLQLAGRTGGGSDSGAPRTPLSAPHLESRLE